MINYIEKLRELRFNFRPEEILDYQELVSLVGNLMISDEQFQQYKEELFHTLQILVLVYGLEDQLENSNFHFDPNNININDLDLWKHILCSLYEIMAESNDFNINEEAKKLVFSVLNVLDQNTPSLSEISKISEKTSTPTQPFTNENDQEFSYYGHNKKEEPDEDSYEFVEPTEEFNFTKLNDELKPKDETCCDNTIDLSQFNWDYLKDYIIDNNLLPYRCDCCGLNEWQGKLLQLKLSRKNPNDMSQNLNNLILLCPNCYSQIGKK